MSLVAYASSDEESNESETERENRSSVRDLPHYEGQENADSPCKKKNIEQDREINHDVDIINDATRDEKASENSGKRSIFSFLPPPKKEIESYVMEEDDSSFLLKKKESHEPNMESEDNLAKELEANVVKRSTKLILPKPKGSNKDVKKQTMKIAVPNLPDIDSDSDDEGTSEKKKRLKKSEKHGSGLIGCLPQPLQRPGSVTIKRNNEKKPSRLLIPYTLSKKKEDSKINKAKKEDSESESDEESSSFFLLSESLQIMNKTTEDIVNNTNEVSVNKQTLDNLDANKTAVKVSEYVSGQKSRNGSSGINVNSQNLGENFKNLSSTGMDSYPATQKVYAEVKNSSSGIPLQAHDVTKDSKSQITWQNMPLKKDKKTSKNESATGLNVEDSVIGPYPGGPFIDVYPQNKTESYVGSYSTGPYPNANADVSSTFGNYSDSASSAYLNPEPTGIYSQYGALEDANQQSTKQEPLDYNQLRRLQGKRERSNHIDFVDITGEAMTLNQGTFLKNVTEEQSHVSKKLKSDNPSSQQKRKHQITYLAFQAKEREQELRKSWAVSSQSRRQTQQKYGF